MYESMLKSAASCPTTRLERASGARSASAAARQSCADVEDSRRDHAIPRQRHVGPDRIAHLEQYIAEHHLASTGGREPGTLQAIHAKLQSGQPPAGAPTGLGAGR